MSSHLPKEFNPPTEEVLNYIESNLVKTVDKEGNSHDLGFVIIHYSKGQNWLLIHWWAHDDICCQIMARSKESPISFSGIDHRPIHACIWENKIIYHENNAWINSMLNKKPNKKVYLMDKFEDGDY